MKKYFKVFLKIFSPVVVVLLFNFFSYPTIPIEAGVIPIQTGFEKSVRTPVFFFLFDEWSYSSEFLPSLKAVADESVVFHQATSPGSSTNESVPRLIGDPALQDSEFGARLFIPQNSLFQEAQIHGWKNFVAGSYLPYALWFGRYTEFARQLPAYKSPDPNFIDIFMSHFQVGVFSTFAQFNKRQEDLLFRSYAISIQKKRIEAMNHMTGKILRSSTQDTFAFFHFSIPHEPFIGLNGNPSSPEGYLENIRLADVVIGQITRILKERNMWDKSLIVITSDHGWKKDPRLPVVGEEEKWWLLRHVPLLVKFPNQTRSMNINKPFKTIYLKRFLKEGFKTGVFDIESLIRE